MKMYVLVKDSVPLGNVMAAVAHAPLSCYLKYQYHADMEDWVNNSFKKVVCKVDDEQFEAAKAYPRHQLITESSMNGAEIAIAFVPRKEWPEFFQKLKLYRK